MPQLPFSNAMTANQRGLNPVSSAAWAYEYAPWDAGVKILLRATTAGVQATIKTGSQEIQQRAIVQGGGTAGTTPAELNTAPITFAASAGDRIAILLDEVLGGTPTVDGLIIIEPI